MPNQWTVQSVCFGIAMVAVATIPEMASAAELTFDPDLASVQQKIRDIVTKTEERPEFKSTSLLERIEFLAVQQERDLIPAPEMHGPGAVCYLVHAIARRNWWKESRHYLIILLPESQDWKPALVFRTERLDFSLVDLGDLKKYGEDPHAEYRGLRTLQIEEESNHMCTERRFSLWRYDSEKRTFYSILGFVTEFTWGTSKPYEEFKSAIAFQQPTNKPPHLSMDDVVITTNWYKDGSCDANGIPFTPEKLRVDRRKSVLHWNGTKYEGDVDLPEQGKQCWASHQKAWLSGNVEP